MGTPITYLSGGTMGYQSGVFKNATTALGFTFPLTSGYRWWNGVDTSSSQYLLYSDIHSVGQSTVANGRPTAWSTPNLTDQSLLNLINTLPERVGLPQFTSLSAAYQWLQNTGTYFLLRNSIESIIQSNLQMYYDGGWYSSYAGTGTAVTDLSGNNRTGTLYNGTGFNSAGVGAFNFDGTDDYMECPSFNVDAQNEFTLEAWIKLNAVSGSYSIIKKNTSNDNWPIFSLSVTAGDLEGYYSSAIYGQCLEGAYTTNDPILAGVWYYVAFSKGTAGYTSMKLYINGVSVPYSNFLYGTHINNLASSTKPIHIGRSLDGPNWIQPFNGLIPITRIYNKQLSDTEILQNYNVQKGRFGITSPIQNGMVLQLDAANPASYPGAGNTRSFVQAKIYSVYGDGLRSANYTVQCSDDNVNWTTAFAGVASNNSSCGIQVNTGTGTGIYGRYWRYVEGAAIASHHPRVSRIILTDINGIDNNLIVYAANNCNDVGTYIIGTVTKDFGGITTETWNDISGYGNNGTLTNGPTFSAANGGGIVFDGADDYVNIGVNKSCNIFTADFTISAWVYRSGGASYGNVIGDYYTNSTANANEWQLMMGPQGQFNLYNVTGGYIIPNTSAFGLNTWINVCVSRIGSSITMYVNGNAVSTSTSSTTFGTTTGNLNIGIDGNNSSEPLNGIISYVSIYKNIGLTAPQVVQNFYALANRYLDYGVGIVRSGLVLNLDAGNFASYPTSGTTWYDLSGSVFDGTLINGPSYSSSQGGLLNFDGSDDYVNTGQSIASEQFTICAWFKCTNASTYRMIVSKESSGGVPWNYRLFLDITTGNLIGDVANSNGYSSVAYLTNLANNSWYHAVFVRNTSVDKLFLYVNGVEVKQEVDNTVGSITNSQEVWIGRSFYSGGIYPFLGSIAQVQIYNRPLSAGEISTNYNADKARYGL